MINHVKGILEGVKQDSIIVDVNGLGFRIYYPYTMIGKLPSVGQEVKVYTYLHMREDGSALYGFSTADERDFFEQLISVSGVGPKVGQSILATIPATDVRFAIATEDVNKLTKVPGVGKKTAQRMVLELKDKIGKLTLETEMEGIELSPMPKEAAADAISALMALGYAYNEAAKAVGKVRKELGAELSLESTIKKALAVLSER